jgi:hypothetical protein
LIDRRQGRRQSVSREIEQALERTYGKRLPFGLEVGAGCGKAARTVLCGGRAKARPYRYVWPILLKKDFEGAL